MMYWQEEFGAHCGLILGELICAVSRSQDTKGKGLKSYKIQALMVRDLNDTFSQ